MSATITIGGVNITEHVAAMFDALVGSMDWGSGFLSVDQVESILIVAELAGFAVPEIDAGLSVPGSPNHGNRRQRNAVNAWAAQVRAKARAMAQEDGGDCG